MLEIVSPLLIVTGVGVGRVPLIFIKIKYGRLHDMSENDAVLVSQGTTLLLLVVSRKI